MYKRCLAFLLMCAFMLSGSFASTVTYERTEDNLQVSDDIIVTSSNKNVILNTPKVDETEKVYDFADLFTDYEEKELYSDITEFISDSNLDMAIVTIDSNNKHSAENYAYDFYDYNYFGVGDTHDGVLFLIDMDTREMYIATTGEAILLYSDARIDKILDATYEEIANKRYYECADKFIEKAEYYFRLGVPNSNKDYTINSNGDYVRKNKVIEFEEYFATLFLAFFIALTIVFIMKSKHKTVKKATTAWTYMHNPVITNRADTFLTTHTSRVYDPPVSSSSGGGGGSSISSGSSGRSHGGGGRRF